MLRDIVLESYQLYNKDYISKRENCVVYTRPRHQFIINGMIKNGLKGNILEIGAHEGWTTLEYLKIAKEFDRRVYVVDPWDGHQEGSQQVYEIFLKNTDPYKNWLTVLRSNSSHPTAIDFIKKLDLMFVFVDGLHTYEQVKKDIFVILQAEPEIFCVDDIRGPYSFCSELMKAVLEFNNSDYEHVISPENFRDTYFARKI